LHIHQHMLCIQIHFILCMICKIPSRAHKFHKAQSYFRYMNCINGLNSKTCIASIHSNFCRTSIRECKASRFPLKLQYSNCKCPHNDRLAYLNVVGTSSKNLNQNRIYILKDIFDILNLSDTILLHKIQCILILQCRSQEQLHLIRYYHANHLISD